jgi:hypothetical protein
VAGRSLEATFWWEGHHQVMTVEWNGASGELPDMAFGPREQGGRTLQLSVGAESICACHSQVYGEQVCETRGGAGELYDPTNLLTGLGPSWTWVDENSCRTSCAQALAVPDAGCLSRYADDCEALLACMTGDLLNTTQCPDGQARVGGTRRCMDLCDGAHPCGTGTCRPIQGTMVCVP